MKEQSRGYRHDPHSVGLATVHLCFVPKRRKSILLGAIRQRLNEVFQSVAKDKGWLIRSVEIAPDHVHLLVEYDSHHSIAEVS